MLSLHNLFGIMFLKKIIKKTPTYITSISLTILIAFLSLDGNPFDMNRIKLFEGSDKVVHCVMYICLSSAYIFDCAKVYYPEQLRIKSLTLCAITAFAFSLIIEFLQEYMGLGRAFSIGDIVANLAGTLIGFFIMKYYFLKRFNNIMRS